MACYQSLAEVNEALTMPAKVLLAGIGLRDNEQISGSRSIVSDNVRWSSFFVQIFQDDWGPRDLFRKLLLLAIECRDDASLPMRDVVVCIKDAPGETNADILTFRKELEERADVHLFRYAKPEELAAHLREVFATWGRDVIASPSPEAL